VIAFNTPFLISKNGNEFEKSKCSIISADLLHQFTGQNDFYTFIYFDAELSTALQIEAKLKIAQHGLLHYFGNEINQVRNKFVEWFHSKKSDDEAVIAAIDNLIQLLTGSANKEKTIEGRVKEATRYIQLSLHEEISMERIAAKVYLSESRFAHLFKEQIGIPFRRYVLWCRMQVALKAITEGHSFTIAAYEGGFADVAHLSRTFTEMFGVSPSDVLKQ
jgi:AraC-like DNA-binding protein